MLRPMTNLEWKLSRGRTVDRATIRAALAETIEQLRDKTKILSNTSMLDTELAQLNQILTALGAGGAEKEEEG